MAQIQWQGMTLYVDADAIRADMRLLMDSTIPGLIQTSFWSGIVGPNGYQAELAKLRQWLQQLEPLDPIISEAQQYDANLTREYANYQRVIGTLGGSVTPTGQITGIAPPPGAAQGQGFGVGTVVTAQQTPQGTIQIVETPQPTGSFTGPGTKPGVMGPIPPQPSLPANNASNALTMPNVRRDIITESLKGESDGFDEEPTTTASTPDWLRRLSVATSLAPAVLVAGGVLVIALLLFGGGRRR